MGISLDSLNVVKASAAPFTLDIVDDAGNKLGFSLDVIGSNSEVITKFFAKAMNARRTAEDMQRKKGKDVQVTKVEDDIAFANELAAKRIVGWNGIDDEFSPERAIKLIETNPMVREQVMNASDDIRNFTNK